MWMLEINVEDHNDKHHIKMWNFTGIQEGKVEGGMRLTRMRREGSE